MNTFCAKTLSLEESSLFDANLRTIRYGACPMGIVVIKGIYEVNLYHRTDNNTVELIERQLD